MNPNCPIKFVPHLALKLNCTNAAFRHETQPNGIQPMAKAMAVVSTTTFHPHLLGSEAVPVHHRCRHIRREGVGARYLRRGLYVGVPLILHSQAV